MKKFVNGRYVNGDHTLKNINNKSINVSLLLKILKCIQLHLIQYLLSIVTSGFLCCMKAWFNNLS